MSTFHAIALTSICCLATNLAHADTIDNNNLPSSKAFLAYASSAKMLKEASVIAGKFDEKFQLMTSCKTGYTIKPMKVVVFKPVIFNQKTGATDGAWKLNYFATRCNETKIYNVIFVGQAKGDPLVIPYFPGYTMADYTLVKDATKSVMMGASVLTKQKDCQDMSIFDMFITKIPSFDPNKKFNGQWEENWIVQACSERVTVPIKFFPSMDGKGYNFTVSVKPIKR